ncbi:hypothetical protein RRG08_032888 [Elysia crispata]|uniref:Uncharacterized protein n=1 Tax=Elysia crispata TaxID=231223 RepID=A0AAE1AMF2_9GAST|nr:hypothetical protein RRG08_032888 [Elysia crispata]
MTFNVLKLKPHNVTTPAALFDPDPIEKHVMVSRQSRFISVVFVLKCRSTISVSLCSTQRRVSHGLTLTCSNSSCQCESKTGSTAPSGHVPP